MEELRIVGDLVVILAVALAVVFALSRVRVPPIVGFIVAGVLLGPRTSGIVHDAHDVQVLAEIGVVLLLFEIGLELSLSKLQRMWRPVVMGGALQVGLTIGVATAVAMALDLPAGKAVFVGCVIAVSSTAIVLRALVDRREMEAPHGRIVLGILIFQDLSVVPMLLAVPLLAAGAGSVREPLLALLKAAGVLAAVVVAARLLVPRLLAAVAATRQRGLFVMAVIVVCLGTAWAVSLAGISLALGAFLAGMVVAGGEYRHQALSDLIPFREVLTSVFFVSVGMLVDPVWIVQNAGPLVLLMGAILVGKFLLVFLVGLLMRIPVKVAALAAAALAQVGEFSFVLLAGAEGTELVGGGLVPMLSTAAVLTMLITPVLLAVSPQLAAGVGKLGGLARWFPARSVADLGTEDGPPEDHVIIAGYGPAGRELVCRLRDLGRRFVVVDLNPVTVRALSDAGEPAFYGDVTRREVLETLGVERARQMIVVISDEQAAERAVSVARSLAPRLPIVVRARWDADVEAFEKAGATEVISAEREAAVAVAERALAAGGSCRRDVDG